MEYTPVLMKLIVKILKPTNVSYENWNTGSSNEIYGRKEKKLMMSQEKFLNKHLKIQVCFSAFLFM